MTSQSSLVSFMGSLYRVSPEKVTWLDPGTLGMQWGPGMLQWGRWWWEPPDKPRARDRAIVECCRGASNSASLDPPGLHNCTKTRLHCQHPSCNTWDTVKDCISKWDNQQRRRRNCARKHFHLVTPGVLVALLWKEMTPSNGRGKRAMDSWHKATACRAFWWLERHEPRILVHFLSPEHLTHRHS